MTIPGTDKFFAHSKDVNTTISGPESALEESHWYTIDDLSNTVRPYQVFTALLTQSGGYDALEYCSDDPQPLIIGVTYQISVNDGTGDFTNVGALNNNVGTYFIATGTTPNSWGTPGDVCLSFNNGAPVVNVLENTIGNVWFTYTNIGNYEIESNALFTENKTILFASSMNNGNDVNNHTATLYIYAPNKLIFNSWGNTGDNYAELDNTIPLPIEIRVYN